MPPQPPLTAYWDWLATIEPRVTLSLPVLCTVTVFALDVPSLTPPKSSDEASTEIDPPGVPVPDTW